MVVADAFVCADDLCEIRRSAAAGKGVAASEAWRAAAPSVGARPAWEVQVEFQPLTTDTNVDVDVDVVMFILFSLLLFSK
jgi:hypothetical protein